MMRATRDTTLACRRRFCVAMAWVEAASVYYLRVVVDRIVPYQANPLPVRGRPGRRRARARSGDARHAADGRHARRSGRGSSAWGTPQSRSASGTFSTTCFCE